MAFGFFWVRILMTPVNLLVLSGDHRPVRAREEGRQSSH